MGLRIEENASMHHPVSLEAMQSMQGSTNQKLTSRLKQKMATNSNVFDLRGVDCSLKYPDFKHATRLCEGGFGSVHKFKSMKRTFPSFGQNNTDVACKFFGYIKDVSNGRPAETPDIDFIKKEIEFMRDLKEFKCVAQLYGVIQDTDNGYLPDKNPRHLVSYPIIVMELINGGDLIDKIQYMGGKLSEKDLSCMFKGICDALSNIHKKNYVHCDLKLENVMLHSYGNVPDVVKIVDFGCMERMNNFAQFQSPKLFGTEGYFAPESIMTPHTYSAKTDVWQAGLCLYQMLCCSSLPSAFTIKMSPGKVNQVMVLTNEAYDELLFPKSGPIGDYWQLVSLEAKDLLKHCLKRNASERYSIEKILSHPWINGGKASVKGLGKEYENRIKNLTLRKELKEIFMRNPESDEAVEKLFKSIDTDNNKEVDFQELMTGIKTWLPSCQEAEVSHIFNVIDSDGNGRIDFTEFRRFYTMVIQTDSVRRMSTLIGGGGGGGNGASIDHRAIPRVKVPFVPFKSRYADKSDKDGALYRCEPKDIMHIPKIFRTVIGHVTLVLFACSFWVYPSCILFAFESVRQHILGQLYAVCIIISLVGGFIGLGNREWPLFRRLGQFWFEIFQFHSNISPKSVPFRLDEGDQYKYIIGMHPHGVVPYHALLWSAFCDLYLSNIREGGTQALYGFGATADVCTRMPFLKNIMAWNSAASCNMPVLRAGLKDSDSPVCGERKPRHLYILPGGIAELFLSKPGSHHIRELNDGLIRLSLETGARLIPCYVFGATDFFHNLITGDWFLPKIFRKMRVAITVYWGWFLLPIPFTPKVTLVVGDPLVIEKYSGDIKNIPESVLEAVRTKYRDSMISIFETYKAGAGYPNAQLQFDRDKRDKNK